MGRKKYKISKFEKASLDKEEVEKKIVELAKKGYSSSLIGEYLKEKYNIYDVKAITGKRIIQIMKENGVYSSLPEDILSLMRRAVMLREHLKVHRKDKHSARGLQLIESKIRSLAKYYIREGILSENWKYDPEEAKIIVGKEYGQS